MDYYKLPASKLRELMEKKKCSATEVMQSVLERTAAVEDKVGAYITLCEESALQGAKEIDSKRAAGEKLPPLAGIPLGVKDNICTKGVLTTCGSKMLHNFVPPYHATVMDKLEAAGMVMTGKLNMDEFAMGSSCETSFFKKSKNPHNLNYVPGGSSGGSGAAVAAGECPVALGSDTGGSIRLPASYCGLVGLKPTYGTVSRYGAVAFASSLEQISPIARTVEDIALVYQAMCGVDKMDATTIPHPESDFTSGLGADIKGKVIGVPKEYFGPGVDAEVKESVMAAVTLLEGQGANVQEVSLPSTEYALSAYYVISSAEASSNLARFDGTRYGYRTQEYNDLTEMYEKTRSEGFGAEVQRRIMLGTNVLSSGYYDAYYKRAKLLQQQITEEFNQVLQECDLLITPTAPSTAFRLGENIDDPVKMYASDICTVTVSIAGLPAISVPCGKGTNGLPIGMQMIGRKFSEAQLLAAANHYETLSGGFGEIPQII